MGHVVNLARLCPGARATAALRRVAKGLHPRVRHQVWVTRPTRACAACMGQGADHICAAGTILDDRREPPMLAICDQVTVSGEAVPSGAPGEMMGTRVQAAVAVPPGEAADQGAIHVDFGEQDSEDDVFGHGCGL